MERHFEIATVVAVPYGWVGEVARSRPDELLGPGGSAGEGVLQGELAVELAGVELRKSVRISVLGLEEAGLPHPRLEIALRWEADDHPEAFPALEAVLEGEPISPAETLIALRGTYRPPLGPVGYAADLVFLHRVARAALQGFFAGVVNRLEEAHARGDELRGEPLI